MPAEPKKPSQPFSRELVEGLKDPGTFEDMQKVREIGGDSVGQ
jgi:hypothetical protein